MTLSMLCWSISKIQDHNIDMTAFTASWLECAQVKAVSTLKSSQAVPHPSTNRALCRLTSEVRRDPVRSTWYGRQQLSIYRVSRQITD